MSDQTKVQRMADELRTRCNSMALPPGKTCADCRHFTRTCEWLISCPPTNTHCDWAPSRFTPKP